MARKPGKPTRSKRGAKRAGKAVVEKTAINPRRKPAVAVPSPDDDAVLEDIDASLGRGFEPSDDALVDALHRWRGERADYERRFAASRIPVR